MKKRVFLIHGWKGTPQGNWFPWLSLELKARGFEVNAPQMPHADKPKVKEWLSFLTEYVDRPNKDTYFIGHSLGCVAVARYLATLPPTAKIGGCVFVAGFSGFVRKQSERLQNLDPAPTPGQARVRIAQPLLGEARARMASGAGVGQPFYTIPEISEFYLPPQTVARGQNAEYARTVAGFFDLVRQHCDKFVNIFSDNDGYVPLEDSFEFAKQLGAKTILERGKGHFTAHDSVSALPSTLHALLRLSDL